MCELSLPAAIRVHHVDALTPKKGYFPAVAATRQERYLASISAARCHPR